MFDFCARERQHADHIIPIWHGLDPKQRGTFFTIKHLEGYLIEHGVDDLTFNRVGTGNPIIVSSYQDMKASHGRDVIFVEHGAGQTYTVPHPSYSGGAERESVRLFLCPNERVAQNNLKSYPKTPALVVGSPRLEWLSRIEHKLNRRPVVGLSFHWDCRMVPESRWAFPHYEKILRKLTEHYKILGHGHPRIFNLLERRYLDVNIEPVRDFEEVVARADVYVCDNSSTIYEFAALGRPVVVLNAPWYRRNVEQGLRFWEFADIGIQVNEPEELVPSIHMALNDPPKIRKRRKEISMQVYNQDSLPVRRAIEAMEELLGDDQSISA